MKWIIAALLLLFPTNAFAQCNGIFPPNTVCGNSTGSPALPGPTIGSTIGIFTSTTNGLVPASGGGTTNFLRADATWAAPPAGGTPASPTGSVQYNNAGSFGAFGFWDGSATLSLGNSTTAQGFRVYNTVDTLSGPTNFERGVFDWTTSANTLTIGTQAGGTGSARTLKLVSTADVSINAASGQGVSVTAALLSIFNGGISVQDSHAMSWGGGGNHGPALNSVNGNAVPVLTIGDQSGSASNTSGWTNWAGEARLDADFSATSNTTLANVTGSSHSLTVGLQAARNYIFEISLPMVTGATAGGIKIALGGTATVTNLIADGICMDGPTAALISTTRVSTLATAIVATTNAGTTPKCTLSGTFEVNVAGTFTVQFAQNASSGTASTVKRGAYMMVNDAP